MKTNNKIVTVAKLEQQLTDRSNEVVACSGSFDLLHAGHISYLAQAKAKGDFLVVFLNSDKSIRRYKGQARPIMPENERGQIIASIEYVDAVVLFDELTPLSLIEHFKPNIFCNGSDWGENPIEKSLVESYGGSFFIVSPETRNQYSSSMIIDKIKNTESRNAVKAIFLDRDGILIEDHGYVHKPEDVLLMNSVVEGLQKLRDQGWVFFVITNQSGIGRGMYSESEMHTVNNKISELLGAAGIEINEFFFCPHHPEDRCLCRKPGTELLETAADKYGLPLSKCWLIGDKLSDIQAGRSANMHTLLISDEFQDVASTLHTPDFRFQNFADCVQCIIAESNKSSHENKKT